MIIVFEGCDNVGKTTIAKKLAEILELPYYRYLDQRKAVKENDTYNITKYSSVFFADFIQHVNFSCIIDRHYPSEWVYAQVFNRHYDIDVLRQIDEGFMKANVNMIVCYKSKMKHFMDWNTPLSKVKEIQDKYREFVQWSNVKNIFELDTTNEDIDKQIEAILNFLEMSKVTINMI